MPAPSELGSPERLSELDLLLRPLRRYGVRLGLTPIRRILEALGRPQDRLETVLVAGTNGKGSTAALLEAMARSAGYRTGLFTSPHLECEGEQLRIDGRSQRPADLAHLLAEILATTARHRLEPPTIFEAWTVLAFTAFARAGVDLAILEVGMGGRRDATNAGEPRLAVLTNVSLDHDAALGPTVAEIADEKAGIFRPDHPAVLGWTEASTGRLRQRLTEVGAHGVFAAEEVRNLRQLDADRHTQRIAFVLGDEPWTLRLALLGDHQAKNAALAVLAARALRVAGFERLDRAAIERGAAACHWPGRLEWLEGPRPVLLDAAHNLAGAGALARYLEATGEPFDLCFGALADKDADGMLGLLAPRARRSLLTAPVDGRAWDPAAHLARHPLPGARLEADLDRALDLVLAPLQTDDPTPLVVSGSLRLVGDVRTRLRRRGFPIPDRV